jgi:translation initiation factor IF-3
VVQFKGREMQHTDLGRQLMSKFCASLSDIAVVERPPIVEGRTMFAYLGPKKLDKGKKSSNAESKNKNNAAPVI